MSLDFYWIGTRPGKKNGICEIYPRFIISQKTKELMIRHDDFWAVYDPNTGLWSKTEDTILELMDEEIKAKYDQLTESGGGMQVYDPKYLHDSDSGSIERWHKYCQKQMRNVWEPLNNKVIFSNSKIERDDHASFRLNYAIGEGDCSASREIVETLYRPEQAEKIYYAVGSVIAGYSKHLQKFFVFYGPPKSGKSTVLKMIQRMFGNDDPDDEIHATPDERYWAAFKAENLGKGEAFALEPLKDNPAIGIDHEAKLDNLENNTYINSIASHDIIVVNAKNVPRFSMRFNTLLLMGTNSLVRITDMKSGLLRRLIDVIPSGRHLPTERYEMLVARSKLEKGAFAQYCLDVFNRLGPHYYDKYVARDMIAATNPFYEFVQYQAKDWMSRDFVPLSEIWHNYVAYCEDSGLNKPQRQRVKNELMNYFHEFKSDYWDDERRHYSSVYVGFLPEKVGLKREAKPEPEPEPEEKPIWIKLAQQPSLFDKMAADWPAQYTADDGSGRLLKAWDNCTTTLKDLDTRRVHHVRTPLNHIVIDFDIKEGDQKSLDKNLAAANKWPPTYAEVSKSGQGLHLHYIYTGDPLMLRTQYDDNIEIKVFNGKGSLRRKLTLCNDIPVATISSGLPLREKGGSDVVDWKKVEDEQHLRNKIAWLMTKPKDKYEHTAQAMSKIKEVLDEAYESGFSYNIADMRKQLNSFAWSSHNSKPKTLAMFAKLHLCSKDRENEEFENFVDDISMESAREAAAFKRDGTPYDMDRIVFYDVEVFKNLFVICWKYIDDPVVHSMINPTSEEVEQFAKLKLIGFNNRKYDNHILMGRIMGYNNMQLYNLSRGIISEHSKDFMFKQAYKIGYADIYDYISEKKGLKKLEIELGIHHQEINIPWDEEVPEDKVQKVVEYCCNDVIATEAVFKAKYQDFVAREILADLSGLTILNTTRQHTTRIIFGDNRNPELVYTDLSKTFPGYEMVNGKNMYKGIDVGFGGYVYAEPNMYTHVALLDVASLHPNSIRMMNVFGEYTKNYTDILDARVAIKHHDYDTARSLLGGKLAKYLTDDESADKLAQALKIVINSVYGYTSATFENPFKDPRNVNNIVALRGALFMVTLMMEVQARGFTVAHIKTDSIKIPDATPEIIQFCMDFGKKYGYSFEHEATYEKMCLVNQAVYIAKYEKAEVCEQLYGYVPGDNKKAEKKGVKWTATGAQFQVPYVFKKLFSGEEIEFADLCETKSVSKGDIYLDFNEGLAEDEHDYQFVGRVGLFCPLKPGCGGGILYRRTPEGNYNAVTGTKGYRWLEAEFVKFSHRENDIDTSYYDNLVDEAIDTLSKFGDVDWLRSDEDVGVMSVIVKPLPCEEDEVELPPWVA